LALSDWSTELRLLQAAHGLANGCATGGPRSLGWQPVGIVASVTVTP
jgi:hypothetical protein